MERREKKAETNPRPMFLIEQNTEKPVEKKPRTERKRRRKKRRRTEETTRQKCKEFFFARIFLPHLSVVPRHVPFKLTNLKKFFFFFLTSMNVTMTK